MQQQTSNYRGRRVYRDWIKTEPTLMDWTMNQLSQPAFEIVDKSKVDQMQAALVRLAQKGCETASLCLTCQLLPGLKKLAKTTAVGFSDPGAEVISAFYEVLGTRDLTRRPTKVAANLILDTKQKLYRGLLKDLKQQDISRNLAVSYNAELTRLATDNQDLIGRYSSIEVIAEALASYPPKSRRQIGEIAFMHWIEGYSTLEIADRLNISQTAVTTKIWRLRQKIKVESPANLN